MPVRATPNDYERGTKLLNQLDEFLAEGTRASADLWSVLTALRGPDNGGWTTKAETTGNVRKTALPKTAQAVMSGEITIGADFTTIKSFVDEDKLSLHAETDMRHFAHHIRAAVRALLEFRGVDLFMIPSGEVRDEVEPL